MTAEKMMALLPCPFCGGEPGLITGGPGNWFVRCSACKASTDDTMRDRAAELWNTRASAVGAGAREAQLEEDLKSCRESWHRVMLNKLAADERLAALQSEPVQPAGKGEQEPVAWLVTWPDGGVNFCQSEPPKITNNTYQPLYALPSDPVRRTTQQGGDK